MTAPVPENTPPSEESASPRSFPLRVAIGAGIVVLIAAALIISRVAGPLAGLLAPGDPPFFEPATLIEHRVLESGVDEWLFATAVSGCEVFEWYAARATLVSLNPSVDCAVSDIDPTHDDVYSIGYCQGSEPFGDFAADWEIYISDGYNDGDGRTRFLLAREVDWINQD